jgi:lysophospholipase L1-like esterase
MNIPKTQIITRSCALFMATFLTFTASAHALDTEVADSSLQKFNYVAIGDSITTGSSVATCQEDRQKSPWGCAEVPTIAMPYPTRLAWYSGGTYSDQAADYRQGHLDANKLNVYRAGIWGYTVQEAAQAQNLGHNRIGEWMPQLEAISHASRLVTGNLGINDLHFSDVVKWAKLYVAYGKDKITPEVQRILKERSGDFDQLFAAYTAARANGAKVITTLYYNPYDSNLVNCQDLKTIADRIVNTLDNELQKRATAAHIETVDFRQYFGGHGAGSSDPYVFGSHCSISGAFTDLTPKWLGGGGGKRSLAIGFDPHPNNSGSMTMYKQIMEKYNGAD